MKKPMADRPVARAKPTGLRKTTKGLSRTNPPGLQLYLYDQLLGYRIGQTLDETVQSKVKYLAAISSNHTSPLSKQGLKRLMLLHGGEHYTLCQVHSAQEFITAELQGESGRAASLEEEFDVLILLDEFTTEAIAEALWRHDDFLIAGQNLRWRINELTEKGHGRKKVVRLLKLALEEARSEYVKQNKRAA